MGLKNYNRPHTVQNRAQLAFLGVHRYASNVVVHGDMGWAVPTVRRKLNILGLWARLERMPDSRLTKRIYLWDRDQKCNNWSRDCKKVLKEVGEPDLWSMDGRNINIKALVERSKVSLMSKVNELWKRDLGSQPKLRTYRTFKHERSLENYASINISRVCRSYIAKIRSGTLTLRIETGRFEKLEEQYRLCKFCDNKKIENEFHFIFECNQYHTLRTKLFDYVCNVFSRCHEFRN